MKNFIVGQSGGPTAIINSSLAGVIKKALESDKVEKVFGMVNGIEGFLAENIIELDKFSCEDNLNRLRQTPSSYLGSCRKKLPEIEGNDEFYENLFNLFEISNCPFF